MSVIDLADFKAYLRELTTALDDPLQMALDAAIAEASGFVGFDLDEAYGWAPLSIPTPANDNLKEDAA